jgi:hypothetical protein
MALFTVNLNYSSTLKTGAVIPLCLGFPTKTLHASRLPCTIPSHRYAPTLQPVYVQHALHVASVSHEAMLLKPSQHIHVTKSFLAISRVNVGLKPDILEICNLGY